MINHGARKLSIMFPDRDTFAVDSHIAKKQLISGVLAGVSAAVVSQPADVLLSKLCGSSSSLTECIILDGFPSIMQACRDIGFRGCYAGLAPRAVMVGILTALQFFVYETAKKKITLVSHRRKAKNRYFS